MVIEQLGQITAFLLGHGKYLAVFAGVFIAIETFWPAIPAQGHWRTGTWTDLVLSFGNPLIVQPLNDFLIAALLASVLALAGVPWLQTRQLWIAAQPVWMQVVAAFVVADLAAYWKHRIFHMRLLWPFHAIHHSATEVDWLTNDRDHPVQLLGTYLVLTSVMVLAGFSPELIALQSFWRRFYSLYTHANVSWSYGPLNRIFVSPAFHRWHHASDARMTGKNFAVMLSLFDVLFGSYCFPDELQPAAFGLADHDNPDGLAAVLAYPWVYATRRV